jgi:hypothetical protein
LNASLGVVEAEISPGIWVKVQYGDKIKVTNDVIAIRLKPGNTGDAKWLSKAAAGSVVLLINNLEQPIPGDVESDRSIAMNVSVLTGEVKLQMRCKGRADFGEVLRFTLTR